MTADSIRCKCSIDDASAQKVSLAAEPVKCQHILNLIKGGQLEENVWTVKDFQQVKKRTFLEIGFNSPVLIRGFAIQSSANADRDPMNFSFWGVDYPENRGSDGI